MKKTGIKMLILNKERKSYDKLYQGFGICSKGKDMNIYFDGRGHCIQLTEGQIMLLKMIRQLSSSNDDITLAYNLDEKVFQLVTLWEREYVLNQEGKEIIISEDEMQRVTEMFNQRNLVRKKEID